MIIMLQRKSNILFLLLAFSTLFVLIACSNNGSDSKNPGGNSEDYYANLKDEGVIRVGSTVTGPPFTFLNENTGELEGFMVDITELVAEDLDLDVEIVETEFSSLIPAIEHDRIDLIAAGMMTTDERKEKIDFSDK